jgi:hypothetical protein
VLKLEREELRSEETQRVTDKKLTDHDSHDDDDTFRRPTAQLVPMGSQ